MLALRGSTLLGLTLDSDPCHHLPYLQLLPHLTSSPHCSSAMPKRAEGQTQQVCRGLGWSGCSHFSRGLVQNRHSRGWACGEGQHPSLPSGNALACVSSQDAMLPHEPLLPLSAGISRVSSQTTTPHRVTTERFPRSPREVPTAFHLSNITSPPFPFLFPSKFP